MREELPADLFLIGFRKLFDLGNRLFERLCHDGTITARRAMVAHAQQTDRLRPFTGRQAHKN
jgi:hypothetical protein